MLEGEGCILAIKPLHAVLFCEPPLLDIERVSFASPILNSKPGQRLELDDIREPLFARGCGLGRD
jgi:hypothetical protein